LRFPHNELSSKIWSASLSFKAGEKDDHRPQRLVNLVVMMRVMMMMANLVVVMIILRQSQHSSDIGDYDHHDQLI
jgi:hypothetical protein